MALFFDGSAEDKDQQFQDLPEHFKPRVDTVLRQLKRCLASYENNALKHGVKFIKPRGLLHAPEGTVQPADTRDAEEQAHRDKTKASRVLKLIKLARAKLKEIVQGIDKSDWKRKDGQGRLGSFRKGCSSETC